MHVLFIAPRIPFPLVQGDRLICYRRLKALSQHHQITLLTFYQSQDELQHLDRIEGMCHKIHLVHLPKWRSAYNCLTNAVLSTLPFQVAYYQSAEFQATLDRITSETKFDLAHYFLLRMAEYRVPSNVTKIIELIDSMQSNLSSRLKIEKPISKILIREELKRITKYEPNVVDDFRNAILVSELDAQSFTKSSKKIDIIPIGTDVDIFCPQPSEPHTTVRLIFAGHMSYSPNIYAVQWFIDNCWSGVQQLCPNTEFIIAGAHAPSEILSLADLNNVTVTGRVESMAVTLAQADIAVIPMQSGSGMQNKVIEAMSCGLPTIVTSFGLGAITAVPGEHLIVADTADDFINEIARLVKDVKRRAEIGQKARIFIEENHSWNYADRQIEAIYESIKQEVLCCAN